MAVVKRFIVEAGRALRALAIFVVLYLVIGGGLVFALPHTLILFTLLAMLWYFVRTGEWTRFSLRSILIFTAGIAVIAATAALVPAPMLGGSGGVPTKQVIIGVLDKITNEPIIDAEVVLSSRANNQTTNQHSKTNVKGLAEFRCLCGAFTKKSILRTWRTYSTDGWSLEVTAPGYHAAKKILSDTTIEGEGGGPINFHIKLTPSDK